MLELSTDGYRTLFAYEEAIGFMLDEIVPDKDGIGAMAALALAVYEIYQNGLDVFGYLQQIYERYGYFASINAYYFCYSPEKTKEIFNRIRYRSNGSGSDEPAYPESIGGFRVTGIRDLTIGYDSSTADRKATLPSSKSSQMITFQVSDGVKYSATLTLRTSGTEPKIKFYSEMTGSYANRLEIQQALAALVSGMAEELLEPQRNGLIKKSI
jgi:phosphomannomutase